MKELILIQKELKAPKNLTNKFGGYKYRNLEGILEAVKPLLEKNNCTLVIKDDVVECGGRVFVKAIATITNSSGESVEATAFAREAESKKGMDDSQITGTASSYARKYCLNGLFLIDDTKDADSNEYHDEIESKSTIDDAGKKIISTQNAKTCKAMIEDTNTDVAKLLGYVNKKYGRAVKSIDELNVEEWKDVIEVLEQKAEVK